jgi:hypothetical protein
MTHENKLQLDALSISLIYFLFQITCWFLLLSSTIWILVTENLNLPLNKVLHPRDQSIVGALYIVCQEIHLYMQVFFFIDSPINLHLTHKI